MQVSRPCAESLKTSHIALKSDIQLTQELAFFYNEETSGCSAMTLAIEVALLQHVYWLSSKATASDKT